MVQSEIHQQSLKSLAENIRMRKISAREVVQHFLERIEKYKNLNTYISLNPNILSEADDIDQKIASGEKIGPLAGIPIGVKDLICAKGMKTTAGSNMLANFQSTYDATLVSRLKNAGALILGKQNLDEFAMGSSNENSYFGPVKNPWDLTRVPGGSSGGSAAAQAAGLAAASIGTDTGGSIRQPAAFCGVVGLKPTYGRVSRYGIIAYASSLDQAGPIANSIADACLIFETIAGNDSADATTSKKDLPRLTEHLGAGAKGLRVGIVKEYHSEGLDPEVELAYKKSCQILKEQGANIVEISIPLVGMCIPIYYLIASSEASSNLARYDGVRFGYRSDFRDLSAVTLEEFYSRNRGEGFGSEVKRRLILGTYSLSAGYQDQFFTKACQVRRVLAEQFQTAFSKCDVLLSPVTATPAFAIGERIADPLKMYLNDVFTTAANLVGIPALSLPFSLSQQNLPISVQLMANHYNEQVLASVGQCLEIQAPIGRTRAL